jgi:hypothetical protein
MVAVMNELTIQMSLHSSPVAIAQLCEIALMAFRMNMVERPAGIE